MVKVNVYKQPYFTTYHSDVEVFKNSSYLYHTSHVMKFFVVELSTVILQKYKMIVLVVSVMLIQIWITAGSGK